MQRGLEDVSEHHVLQSRGVCVCAQKPDSYSSFSHKRQNHIFSRALLDIFRPYLLSS